MIANYVVHPLKFAPRTDAGKAIVKFGSVELSVPIDAKATEAVLRDVQLPEGDGRLEPMIRIGNATYGVQYAEVERQG